MPLVNPIMDGRVRNSAEGCGLSRSSDQSHCVSYNILLPPFPPARHSALVMILKEMRHQSLKKNSLLTNIGARRSSLKTSSEKSSESCQNEVSYEGAHAKAQNLQNGKLSGIQGIYARRRARRAQSRPDRAQIWVESADPSEKRATLVQFQSLEDGAKLLSPKNRALLRLIADRQPKSVSELATLTRRAEQNLLRTLHKLSEAGLVLLGRGEGRAYQPVVTARRVHFEIDFLG